MQRFKDHIKKANGMLALEMLYMEPDVGLPVSLLLPHGQ